jgi:YD repeat-containing protein
MGLLKSATDENGQTTSYSYNDPLDRLTEIDYPDGGQTTVNYNDSTFSASANTPNFTTTTKMTPNPSIQKETAFDGLGHTVRTILLSDPSGSDYVDTTYDGMGRVYTVTTSYRGTTEPTYGKTQYTYDGIGRKTIETNPDVTAKQWCYDGIITTGQTNCQTHLGSMPMDTWVDASDENGNDWQRTSDGLGRLIEVMEPNGASQAPSMETDYSYDLLNDLTFVKQWGGPNGTAGARTRSFAYDSLSRLGTATNPETGTVNYAYDLNSNLQTRIDARGITTNYMYDVLNRVVSKIYTGDASLTPFSCYQYDTSSGTCPLGSSYSVGHLTNAWSQSASTTTPCSTPTVFLTKRSNLCYDQMGRILNEQQYTLANQATGAPYSPAYTYDVTGNLQTSTSGVGPTHASPITFANTFDGAGRLQTVVSSWTNGSVFPATLFSPSTQQGQQSNTYCTDQMGQYSASGGLMNAQFGGGLTLNRSYNNRLRTTCENDVGSGATQATPGSATVSITGSEQTTQ